MTLSSMYFMILAVSSGRLAVTKAARGLAGRSGKSSPLSDSDLVRLAAFFKLILCCELCCCGRFALWWSPSFWSIPPSRTSPTGSTSFLPVAANFDPRHSRDKT
uniref:(northern house mosquito) hypothetical protein n=1 Tax=Culex pipiens TaxID=7175 RepID=A0A8D8CRD2_CULPI